MTVSELNIYRPLQSLMKKNAGKLRPENVKGKHICRIKAALYSETLIFGAGCLFRMKFQSN